MHALVIAVLFNFYSLAFAAPVIGVDDTASQLNFDDWVQDDCEVEVPPSYSATESSVSAITILSSSASSTPVETSTALPSFSSTLSPSQTAFPATTSVSYSFISSPIETTVAATTLPTTPSKASTLIISSSAPSTSSTAASGKYPFSQVVAFGDNLSDNGNGGLLT